MKKYIKIIVLIGVIYALSITNIFAEVSCDQESDYQLIKCQYGTSVNTTTITVKANGNGGASLEFSSKLIGQSHINVKSDQVVTSMFFDNKNAPSKLQCSQSLKYKITYSGGNVSLYTFGTGDFGMSLSDSCDNGKKFKNETQGSQNEPGSSNIRYCYGDSSCSVELDDDAKIIKKVSCDGAAVLHSLKYEQFKNKCPKISAKCNERQGGRWCEVSASEDKDEEKNPIEYQGQSSIPKPNEIHSSNVDCKTLLGKNDDPTAVAFYLNVILQVIKYAVLGMLIVLTVKDYTQAFINMKNFSAANKNVVYRFILALLLFVGKAVIDILLGLFGIVGACDV